MAVHRSTTKRPLDDRTYLANSIDTGQSLVPVLDTGQFEGARFEILSQDIHRSDIIADGSTETVMSTLRKFTLRVGLRDQDGLPVTNEDGLKLQAILITDSGHPVTDLSQSQEPPLLGGEAILDNGEATFELRVTVLSSLCRNNKFRVQVSAAGRPKYRLVMTGPMRTITKLHRTPTGKAKLQKTLEGSAREELPPLADDEAASISAVEPTVEPLEWPVSLFDEFAIANEAETVACPERSREELWQEVTANNSRILELQTKQSKLIQMLLNANHLKAGSAPALTTAFIEALPSPTKSAGEPSFAETVHLGATVPSEAELEALIN